MSAPRPYVFGPDEPPPIRGGDDIARHHLGDESRMIGFLLDHARVPPATKTAIDRDARVLVEGIRRKRRRGLDAFLVEYDLSTAEGVVLMCLAEALLRIPDADTADKLIAEKLGDANWRAHIGASPSL